MFLKISVTRVFVLINFIEKETLTQVLSSEFFEILKNTFFIGYIHAPVPVIYIIMIHISFSNIFAVEAELVAFIRDSHAPLLIASF